MQSVVHTAGPSRTAAWSATRVTVAAFGGLAALAGAAHGIGEIRQGSTPPESVVFRSWADTPAFEALDGEPAMSLVPDLALTGALAIVASLALGVWAVGFAHRRHGGLVLVGLSVVVLLVGGGFGPPLMGAVAGIGATAIHRPPGHPGTAARVVGRAWPWLLGIGLLAFLVLLPGVPLLSWLADVENPVLVAVLAPLGFAGLVGALVAARARDRVAA